jgi:hypothetical protein
MNIEAHNLHSAAFLRSKISFAKPLAPYQCTRGKFQPVSSGTSGGNQESTWGAIGTGKPDSGLAGFGVDSRRSVSR